MTKWNQVMGAFGSHNASDMSSLGDAAFFGHTVGGFDLRINVCRKNHLSACMCFSGARRFATHINHGDITVAV